MEMEKNALEIQIKHNKTKIDHKYRTERDRWKQTTIETKKKNDEEWVLRSTWGGYHFSNDIFKYSNWNWNMDTFDIALSWMIFGRKQLFFKEIQFNLFFVMSLV